MTRALQEFLQGRGQPPAEYRLASESGPDHQKLFQVEVWVDGERMASGAGICGINQYVAYPTV